MSLWAAFDLATGDVTALWTDEDEADGDQSGDSDGQAGE